MGFIVPVGRRAKPQPPSYYYDRAGDNSRRELEREYGRQFVAQLLTVWNGLTKAVETDKTIADIVVGAKTPSSAWKIPKSMTEDESSERAREQTKKNFEGLSMDNAE